jgi:hypothetical protein
MTVSDIKGLVIQRLNESLANFVGEPKGDDWEPSPKMWDHVYGAIRKWMGYEARLVQSVVHRDEDGKILNAKDMTSMYFDAMRTGRSRVIYTTAVPRHPVRCITVRLVLEDQDAKEEAKPDVPEEGEAGEEG